MKKARQLCGLFFDQNNLMIRTIITSLLMLCCLGINSQMRLRPLGIVDMEKRHNLLFDNLDTKAECQYISVSDRGSIPPVFYVHIDDSCDVKEKYKLSVKLSDNTKRTMISDKQTVLRLRALFRSSVNTATFQGENSSFPSCFVFDGLNGACCDIFGTGYEVDGLVERVVDAVNKNSKKELDGLLPAVESLSRFYKSLYPEDYFDITQGSSHSFIDKKTTCRLTTCNGQVSFCFAVSQDPFIESLMRDLFHKSIALDLYNICIIVDDNLTRSANVTSKEATFVIHEADITEEILRNILVRNLDE